MRNILEKSCRENQNTHYMSNDFFFFENRAVYEIMWKNIVEPDRPQMTIWRMRIACWISKATNTHSEYELLLSTATMGSRTRLNVMLYANFLSFCCKSMAQTFSGFSRQYVARQVVTIKTEALNSPPPKTVGSINQYTVQKPKSQGSLKTYSVTFIFHLPCNSSCTRYIACTDLPLW